MRDAKVGAEDAIKSYAEELETDYAKQASHRQALNGGEKELKDSTDKDIALLNKEFKANKDKVAAMLVDIVCKTNA